MPWTSPTTKSTGNTITAANWNELVNNFLFLREVAYQEFISDVNVTSQTEGNHTIVSAGAVTFENVPHLIEFYVPFVGGPGSGTCVVSLYDSTTQIERWGSIQSTTQFPQTLVKRITPSTGSHTYIVKAHNTAASQTSTFGAGPSGPATRGPGFIRITRIPT